MTDKLLTPAQLRKSLNIGQRKYDELMKDGMPHVPMSIGKKVTHRRYDLDKVIAWLEDRDKEGASDA